MRGKALVKNRSENHKKYVRRGGLARNYVRGTGGPRKKYVCEEGGGVSKNLPVIPPPYFFFGIALTNVSTYCASFVSAKLVRIEKSRSI